MKKPLYQRREEAMQAFTARRTEQDRALKRQKLEKKSGSDLLRVAIRHKVPLEQLMLQANRDAHLYSLLHYMDMQPDQRRAELWLMVSNLVLKFPQLIQKNSDLSRLKMLCIHTAAFVRPMEDWKPSAKRAEQIWPMLQRHLFAQYEAPACIENSFWGDDPQYVEWYLRWVRGERPRDFIQVPYMKITARMIHLLQEAPAAYPVPAALRWAQARTLDMAPDRARAVAEAFHLVQDVFDAAADWTAAADQHPEAFAESLIHFFARARAFAPADYVPVIDYVFQKKYALQRRQMPLADGVVLRNAAFSMKGRTPAALMRDVHEWHRHLGYTDRYKHLPESWKGVAVSGLYLEEKVHQNTRVYVIRQLTTQRALFQEGTQLRHCVASYIEYCMQGRSSIWTMEVMNTWKSTEKLLTIELQNGNRIVQARGKANRLATSEERRILEMWAERNNLSVNCM